MPQLVPFYFTNQTVLTFISISFILYVSSRYILPEWVRNAISREIFS